MENKFWKLFCLYDVCGGGGGDGAHQVRSKVKTAEKNANHKISRTDCFPIHRCFTFELLKNLFWQSVCLIILKLFPNLQILVFSLCTDPLSLIASGTFWKPSESFFAQFIETKYQFTFEWSIWSLLIVVWLILDWLPARKLDTFVFHSHFHFPTRPFTFTVQRSNHPSKCNLSVLNFYFGLKSVQLSSAVRRISFVRKINDTFIDKHTSLSLVLHFQSWFIWKKLDPTSRA